MTACDMLPPCFAEGKGFRRLSYTEPEHTVLRRTTVMSQLELSLMFANVCNLNNKWHKVRHITAAFELTSRLKNVKAKWLLNPRKIFIWKV